MSGGERGGELDEREPGVVGECSEGVGGVELGRVGRVECVVPGWQSLWVRNVPPKTLKTMPEAVTVPNVP